MSAEQRNESPAATTELRALLAQEAVHDPPWHVADDDGQPYICGKRGPGWYDSVADEVSNKETAKLIVGAVNALPALLNEIEWLRDVAHAAECLIKSEDVRLGDEDQIRLSNLLCDPRRPL